MKKYFIVISLIFASCSKDYNIENKSLTPRLQEMTNNTIFSFKDIDNSSWDTLFVSKPYQDGFIEEKKLVVPNDVNRVFKDLSTSDNSCVLIFTKKNKVVSYSIIQRKAADFSFVDKQNRGLLKDTQFKIVSDTSYYKSFPDKQFINRRKVIIL